jgi:hypothetical protein
MEKAIPRLLLVSIYSALVPLSARTMADFG